MSDHKHEQADINELTKLTPFGLDVYKTRGKFKSGGIFVETHVLESAKPLQPWSIQADNESDSVRSANL
ncbi:hypothetical protein [Limnofasciculus baicalensis]|nr:hypothetical protein [Limnofasciculus baicalensis]